jgi:hypothetical protein
LGNTFIESFSCPIKKAVEIQQAKDRAKEYGKKWSEYVVELIEADNKEHSQQDRMQQNSGIISILNNGEQVCITEFIPRLYENLARK